MLCLKTCRSTRVGQALATSRTRAYVRCNISASTSTRLGCTLNLRTRTADVTRLAAVTSSAAPRLREQSHRMVPALIRLSRAVISSRTLTWVTNIAHDPFVEDEERTRRATELAVARALSTRRVHRQVAPSQAPTAHATAAARARGADQITLQERVLSR